MGDANFYGKAVSFFVISNLGTSFNSIRTSWPTQGTAFKPSPTHPPIQEVSLFLEGITLKLYIILALSTCLPSLFHLFTCLLVDSLLLKVS